MSRLQETLNFEHAQIHRAKMHHVSSASVALADNGSIGLVLSVGADKDLHFVFGVAGGGRGRVILYEDVTLTSSTLCLTACSMNREHKAGACISASFGHTPVFAVATGSVLLNEIIPGTTGGNKAGGHLRLGAEWIGAESTNYIVAACNLSGGAAAFSVAVECYEH